MIQGAKNRAGILQFFALTVLLAPLGWAQRICLSPDALYVDSTRAAQTSHLFVYVPPTTGEFTLAVFDQADEDQVKQPSSFVLFAPDGSEAMRLGNPKDDAWSEYKVDVNGRWGIWRLTVTGPQPPQGQAPPARNHFLVRTVGEVDLFIKPEPAVLIRGLYLSEPKFGGEPVHRLWVQVPELSRIRLNLRRPREEQSVEVRLQPPPDVAAKQRWGGLHRGSLEFLEVTGPNLQGLWPLTISNVTGIYALGIEQELRVFFTDKPLMPMPQAVRVTTFMAEENLPLPSRLTITSPQTATETHLAFTDREGRGTLFLLPGISYRVTASHGFEFASETVPASSDLKAFTVSVKRVLRRPPGWYCGDTHTHTVYSDGSHTPAQMVEAARGDGLDWLVLTDHGVGPNIPHVLEAHREALPLSEPGRFVVLPGVEFTTTPNYHANIINGTIGEPATAPLQRVVEVVSEMDSDERPMTMTLNHPYWPDAPRAPELARQVERLPLLELWNDEGKDWTWSTSLWWELLNKGMRTFAATGSDSHSRRSRFGGRRVYIHLGQTPLTAANIVRALREGRSFLSRGAALLLLSVNGALPGSTVGGPPVEVQVWAQSTRPLDRVEIVHNGKVVHTFRPDRKPEFAGQVTLPIGEGWLLALLFVEGDPAPGAMTNPVFVRPGGPAPP